MNNEKDLEYTLGMSNASIIKYLDTIDNPMDMLRFILDNWDRIGTPDFQDVAHIIQEIGEIITGDFP